MSSGNRKVSILPKNLPPVIKLADDSYGYISRHRIISEDRNRFSAWSVPNAVSSFNLNSLPEQIDGDLSISGASATAVWDDSEARPSYDIFVSFDGGDYLYHGTSPIHTYTFLIKDHTTVDVKIQIQSINKELATVLTIATMTASIGS